jgi:hypothetical protein
MKLIDKITFYVQTYFLMPEWGWGGHKFGVLFHSAKYNIYMPLFFAQRDFKLVYLGRVSR